MNLLMNATRNKMHACIILEREKRTETGQKNVKKSEDMQNGVFYGLLENLVCEKVYSKSLSWDLGFKSLPRQ